MDDQTHHLPLTLTTQAPREARSFVGARIGHVPDVVREDILLLVSEVVTNALLHGEKPAHLDLTVTDRVRVAVHDSGLPFSPRVRFVPGPTHTSGRGMTILDALATTWGVEAGVDGRSKAVWFEV